MTLPATVLPVAIIHFLMSKSLSCPGDLARLGNTAPSFSTLHVWRHLSSTWYPDSASLVALHRVDRAMRKWKRWLVVSTALAFILLCAYLARPYPPRPPGLGVSPNGYVIPAQSSFMVYFPPALQWIEDSNRYSPTAASLQVSTRTPPRCAAESPAQSPVGPSHGQRD